MFLDLTSWHPLLVFWTGFSVSSLYSYFAGVFFHAVCLDIQAIAIFLIGLYNPWDQIAIFIRCISILLFLACLINALWKANISNMLTQCPQFCTIDIKPGAINTSNFINLILTSLLLKYLNKYVVKFQGLRHSSMLLFFYNLLNVWVFSSSNLTFN